MFKNYLRKSLSILLVSAMLLSQLPVLALSVTSYQAGESFKVYSNPLSPYNTKGRSYGWTLSPNAFIQNYSYTRTFAKNFYPGDGIVHEPNESLDGNNTKIIIGHGIYENTTDLAAVVSYMENGELKHSPSYRFTGYHANGLQDSSLGAHGTTVTFDIGTYPNVVSVNVYHIVASNETIQDYVQFDVVGNAGAVIPPSADIYVETEVMPNEITGATPPPKPSPSPSPSLAPVPSPTPSQGPVGDYFKIYSNPQSPFNKDGKSYVWAKKADAFAQNYSWTRTYTKFFSAGDGIIHEPNAGALDGFNTKITVHNCANVGNSDLAAVVTYKENGEIKYSTPYRFTGYHPDGKQSTDFGNSGTERDFEIGTYPNVVNVNVYHILEGGDVPQDYVQFEKAGAAGAIIPPTTNYYVETKWLPNYVYGKQPATPAPSPAHPAPGTPLDPLITPAPMQSGPVIPLGRDSSFILYPANRDGASGSFTGTGPYVVPNSADFMNRNNGTSQVSVAAGGSITRASNYLIDSTGAVGTKIKYTPTAGLLKGVDTKISIPYWQLNNGGAGLEVLVTYDGGKTDAPQIVFDGKWNNSPAILLELGTYTDIESVELKTKTSDITTIVPVIFTVTNENADYQVIDLPFKEYVKPNIGTVTPGLVTPTPIADTDSSISINEVCSSNTMGLKDKNNINSDWIELYNNSEQAVDISGYGMSDNKTNKFKWKFPLGTTIPAKGYLVIIASGNDTIISGEIHTNFSISKGGEIITLCNKEGGMISVIDLPSLDDDVTMGRYPDGTNNLRVMKPTPKATNNNSGVISTFVEKPHFSAQSGFYQSNFDLTITSQSGSIYYTLDGSTPTANSLSYSGTITVMNRTNEPNVFSAITYNTCSYVPSLKVDKTMVVRAVAIDEQGNSSDVVTKTYFVGYNMASNFNNAMVLSVTTDRDNLWDPDTGMFTNSTSEDEGVFWEREGHLDMFKDDGSLVIDQNVGMRIRGFGSRSQIQKGINFYAKSKYGDSSFDYPLFATAKSKDGKLIDSYKSFCIRTGNQNANTMRFFDGALQSLSDSLGNDWQSSRPCVVFINGEYWGQYYMQERVSSDYVEEHFGVPAEDAIVVKNHKAVGDTVNTDIDLYNQQKDWLAKTDFSIQANYDRLVSEYDIQNMALYYAANLSVMNRDWGAYNFACWRSRSVTDKPYQDGKWRFLMYDLDISYFGEGADMGSQYITNQNGWHPYAEAMMSNPSLRRIFGNTILEVQSGAYDPQRVFNSMIYWDDELRPLMPPMFDRWGLNPDQYNYALTGLYNRIVTRDTYYIQLLKDTFGFTGTYTNLNVKVNDAKMGTVNVNSLKPDFRYGSYTGRYFTDLTSTLTAVPAPGYKFIGWTKSDGTQLTSDTDLKTYVTLSPNGSMVKANFAPDIAIQGSGTENDPYQIATADELKWVADAVNSNNAYYGDRYYVLTNNISFSGSNNYIAIGNKDYPFTGTFDGKRFTIDGINISSTIQGQGLFGYIGQGGTVRNVAVTNITIVSTGTDGKNAGGIAGNNAGTIEYCYSTGSLSGISTVGGITGNNSGTINSCYSIAKINSDSSSTRGGIAGKTELNSVVSNCYSLILPVGKNEGGIIDQLTSSKTEAEFANGSVTNLLNANGEAVWQQGDTAPVFNLKEIPSISYTSGIVNVSGVMGKTEVTVVVSSYSGGKLSDIILKTVTIDADGNGSATVSDIQAGSDGKIKIMLLNNLNSVSPLCNSVMVTK